MPFTLSFRRCYTSGGGGETAAVRLVNMRKALTRVLDRHAVVVLKETVAVAQAALTCNLSTRTSVPQVMPLVNLMKTLCELHWKKGEEGVLKALVLQMI